jgi:hypothetical protein
VLGPRRNVSSAPLLAVVPAGAHYTPEAG